MEHYVCHPVLGWFLKLIGYFYRNMVFILIYGSIYSLLFPVMFWYWIVRLFAHKGRHILMKFVRHTFFLFEGVILFLPIYFYNIIESKIKNLFYFVSLRIFFVRNRIDQSVSFDLSTTDVAGSPKVSIFLIQNDGSILFLEELPRFIFPKYETNLSCTIFCLCLL